MWILSIEPQSDVCRRGAGMVMILRGGSSPNFVKFNATQQAL
jgi:hypothetical protein